MLTKNKPSIDSEAGIYKIPCKDCNLVYIRETGRNIDTRIKEHRYAVKRGDDNNAIYRHVLNKDHTIDWNNSQLLYKCNDLKKRRIIETICIEKYDNF